MLHAETTTPKCKHVLDAKLTRNIHQLVACVSQHRCNPVKTSMRGLKMKSNGHRVNIQCAGYHVQKEVGDQTTGVTHV